MSELNIPRGQTLRQVAERLGVPAEELQKHAKVSDVEAPMLEDRSIEVPDGFLRERRKNYDTVPTETGRSIGMNASLALSIERLQLRLAGDTAAGAASTEEIETLAEAFRIYCRLEADSNALAIDLYQPLTQSRVMRVRAEALGWQAMAHVQRMRLFGEPAKKVKPAALTAAKAALMAEPKTPSALSAMGFALAADPQGDDLRSARSEVERAVAVAPKDPWAWAHLAVFYFEFDAHDAAKRAVEIALEISADCPPALEVAAHLAFARGDRALGSDLFESLFEKLPTYANGRASYGQCLKHLGDQTAAESQFERAISLAQTPAQRQRLRALWATNV